MSKGRKKTPTAILEKRGSWRAKTRVDEPVYEIAGDLTMPKILKADGKAIWQKILPMVIGQGVLTQADLAAFTRYCFYWQTWQELARNPERNINDLVKVEGIVLKLETQFGLTPASRPNVKSEKRDDEQEKGKRHDYFCKVG